MSIKSVCGMNLGEMHEFALALDKAGFNAGLVQEIVNSKNNELAKIMRSALDRDKPDNKYLKCLSRDTSIIIPACDGSHTLTEAKDVFRYIDPNFKRWGLGGSSKPTGKTPVDVYEMAENMDFKTMFTFLSLDLDKLCVTGHQVKMFCKELPNWLRADGCGTFFLIKKNWDMPASPDNLFVARVDVRSDGLYVHARRFEDGRVWYAYYQRRLVIPQLET